MTEQITTQVEEQPQVENNPSSVINLLERKMPKTLESIFQKAQEKLGVRFVLIDYTPTGKKTKIGKELLTDPTTVLVIVPDSQKMASGSTHRLCLQEGGEVRTKSCYEYYFIYPDQEHLIFGEYSSYEQPSCLYGVYLAECKKDAIIFNYDFITDPTIGICDAKCLVNIVLKKFMLDYKYMYETFRGRVKRMVQNFVEFNKHIITQRKKSIRQNIKNKQDEMINHYRGLQRIEREISELNTLSRSNMNRTNVVLSTPVNKLEQTFENFFNGEKCHNIEYFNDRIEVLTNEIHIDYGNVKFYIGKFKIVISFEGFVKMFNLDESRIWDRQIHHPHIVEGVPCLGNIKEMMPKLIHSGDYLTVINICYEFLTSYNRSGPYVAIEKGWLPEGVEWCERCQLARVDGQCECRICEDCGRPQVECRCPTCPRDGVKLVDCDCSECREWNSDDECCEY